MLINMETSMTSRRLLLALPLLLLVSSVALAAPAVEFKSIKGTWMCPECAVLKHADTPDQCEALGHKHALKLDGGYVITFLDTPRAAALIHGGGRDKARIEVCGLYNEKTRTLDVDAYQIDGVWSLWCDVHGRMDFCRSTGEPGVTGSASSAK
jgi:hypothetical protein